MRVITRSDEASERQPSNRGLLRSGDAKGDKVISGASTAA